MKILKRLAVFLIICIAIYLLGPRPATPVMSGSLMDITVNLEALDSWIAKRESMWKVKTNNEARVIWTDETNKTRTEYSIVYLHGFTASQAEGDPVHKELAKTFGCNLYLSRLSMHGLKGEDQLIDLTVDTYWESAKEALVIGRKLGKKVLLVGTSTGGTLALKLASRYPDLVAGVILLSPNISIRGSSAWLLNKPWGLHIARLVTGGKYITPKDTSELYLKHWSGKYRIEAAVQLQQLLAKTMHIGTYKSINQPLLLLYYYKDKDHQDEVVSVDAMLDMFDKIATPEHLKMQVAISDAGDHVIGSHIKSKDVESVINESKSFLHDIMGLRKAIVQSDNLEEVIVN